MQTEVADEHGHAVDGCRILVIRPPQVLSYFNAGHHLALDQVAGDLQRTCPSSAVTVLDASVVQRTWRDIAEDLFTSEYQYIAVMNDLDGIDGIARSVLRREHCPDARTVTFGRLSGMQPGFFERYPFDAVVTSGDYEPGYWLHSMRCALIALCRRCTAAPRWPVA